MKQKLALLIACLLAFGAAAGCKAAEKEQPAVSATAVPASADLDGYRTITGLDPELPVMSAEGVSIPASLYCYWQVYNASLMEYRVYTYAETQEEFRNIMGTGGSYLNWEAPFGGSATLREYLNRQTDETIRHYMALEIVAAENGLTLGEEDLKHLEEERQETASSVGGEEAFDRYIAGMGLSREDFDRISAFTVWFDKLYALTQTEGSPLYVSTDALAGYGMYTDHIYLAKVDLSSYRELTGEAITAKKKKAEELAARIASSADPAGEFLALAEAESEDPYRPQNPDGYVFAPGAMNAAYEAAAKALRPGEVSGVVEGETGFYIILRKDLKEKLNADADKAASLREDYLNDMIISRAGALDVTLAPEIEKLDSKAIYTAFIQLAGGSR